jgi:hypothetical protein
MSYEAAILSAGGDDSVLAKSFIIAVDEAAAQWYSLLSPGVIQGLEDLKHRILSNFQGFQRPELTDSDLFSCKQKDEEPLQHYFRRFVHLRAQAPNVLDVVSIKGAAAEVERRRQRQRSWQGPRPPREKKVVLHFSQTE